MALAIHHCHHLHTYDVRARARLHPQLHLRVFKIRQKGRELLGPFQDDAPN